MSVSKKNMPLWDVLCICVFLYSSFQIGGECTLVRKPENVAVLNEQNVTLNCASDAGRGNIAWSSPTSSKYIYYDNIIASGISVSDENDGNCSLLVHTSMSAAKRYFCVERSSGNEASAELIILKRPVECKREANKETVNVSCFVTFAGNWAPVLECKQWNKDKGNVVLDGVKTNTRDNIVNNITWIYTNNNALYNIYCEMRFEISGKPTETSATNIPDYKDHILVKAYDGSEKKSSSVTTENSKPHSVGVIISICLNVVFVIVIVIMIVILIIIPIISGKKTKALNEERGVPLKPAST